MTDQQKGTQTHASLLANTSILYRTLTTSIYPPRVFYGRRYSPRSCEMPGSETLLSFRLLMGFRANLVAVRSSVYAYSGACTVRTPATFLGGFIIGCLFRPFGKRNDTPG